MSKRQQAPAAVVVPCGAVIVWNKNGQSLRAKVVVYVPAGTAPGALVPEIRGLNRRRVQFNNPDAPRARGHYLVSRCETKERLGEILVYYLPDEARVSPARGAA